MFWLNDKIINILIMKKLICLIAFYFYAVALNINTSAYSQFQKPEKERSQVNGKISGVSDSNKPGFKNLMSGDTIWYESFANGIPAGWQVYDSTGNNFNWIYSLDGPTGAYTGTWPNPEPVLQSTTSSDGFLMLPSDYYNTQPSGIIVTDVVTMSSTITSAPVNCSGYQGVILTFQQKFRYCCSESAAVFKVLVSSNGSTWTAYDVRHSISANLFSPDPDTVKINISTIAGNQPTVYIKFYQAGISHYYWMIDDVALLTAASNDVDLNYVKAWCIKETATGTQSPDGYYSMVPVSQAMKMNFSGSVLNFGYSTQHNVSLNVEVQKDTITEFTSQNSIATLNPAATQTITLLTPYFTPSETGIYTAKYHAVQSEADENPQNNYHENINFENTLKTYARDNEESTYLNPDQYSGGADGDGFGVNYYITSAATVGSISVYIDWLSSTGTSITAQLYRYQGSTRVLQIESAQHSITYSDWGNWVELPLVPLIQGDDSLDANTRYVAFIKMNYGFSSLYIGADNTSPQDYNLATAMKLGNSWYTITAVPMIRLNLATSCGNFVVSESVIMANCYTCQDGAINLSVSGGTPPYSYSWSTGATTQNIDSLLYDNYLVTVTDTLGCIINLNIDLDVDLQPCLTDGGFENIPDFSRDFCPWTTYDGDGDATEIITGVSFPDNGAPGSFIAFNPDSTSPPYSGASPHGGQRFAACFSPVSSSNNDWLISPQYYLLPGSSLSFWVKSHTSSPGPERYVVLISASGNNVVDFTPISPLPYSEAPSTAWTEVTFDLSAYSGDSVYIAIQCISNNGFMFMVDDFIITPTPVQNLSGVITPADVTCYGLDNGELNLTPVGGTGPYSYHWSNGATTQDINGLAPGTYSVTINSANSDTYMANDSISQPPELLMIFNVTNSTGGSDGAIDLNVSGGISPYSYYWSNGSIFEDISGLIPGNYIVSVTDENQCLITGSAQIVIGIEEINTSNRYLIGQNFPNPFSGTTNIPVLTPCETYAEIVLYNTVGEKCGVIFKGHLEKGENVISFDASGYNQGIYLIRFSSPVAQLYRLMTIIR